MTRSDQILAVKKWAGIVDETTHLAVTLTMKQSTNHQKLDRYLATKNCRFFLNRLNKSIFGNAAIRYGKKLEIIAVQETSYSQRLHYHFLIKVPERVSCIELSNLILQHWKSSDFAYNENIIKPCHSSGWISYMLKDLGGASELDIENTYIVR